MITWYNFSPVLLFRDVIYYCDYCHNMEIFEHTFTSLQMLPTSVHLHPNNMLCSVHSCGSWSQIPLLNGENVIWGQGSAPNMFQKARHKSKLQSLIRIAFGKNQTTK